MANPILVVGSVNMDIVARVKSFPRPGETVLTDNLMMNPGGKGANQAVCCAKLGADVRIIARMGDDLFKERLLGSLLRDGVKTDLISIDSSFSTGVAMILVEESGQNEITVASGSNMRLLPEHVAACSEYIAQAKVVLAQLEVPLDTVEMSLRLAKSAGAITILNPAPARRLPDSVYPLVDVLTPNEIECELLSGTRVSDAASAEMAAARLLDKGVRYVIVTLGSRGALLVKPTGSLQFGALSVKAVDTTAAGDAFNGALAYCLSKDESIEESIKFANTVAAYSVTKNGAQASMPTMENLEEFLKDFDK